MSLLALIASLALQPDQPTRFDLSERLKRMDVSWMAADVTKKKAAIPFISEAVAGFFSGKTGQTAESIDKATAKLEGRYSKSSDALSIRTEFAYYEPGSAITLNLTWAYRPPSVLPVRVGSGSKSVELRPGQNGKLLVQPQDWSPELRLNPEIGYLLPVRVGDDTRSLYVSFVRNFQPRVEALGAANNAYSKTIGNVLKRFIAQPKSQETELPLIEYLFTAEAIHEDKQKLEDQENIFYAEHGSSSFRAIFPEELRGKIGQPVTVVIALHGAGGSENMFFESYGRGICVTEALKRNWVFISPRTGPSAINDAIDWLANVRKLPIGKLYLMGHSMGGGNVLTSTPSLKPTAIAVFAPASSRASEAIKSVPTFLAVGRQEMPVLSSAAKTLSNGLSLGSAFREFENCEHLMIVAEAAKEAYAFFDQVK
ncbi:MAG: alpha/beta hydrolase [Fimbriimonadaceae bacterium]